MPALIQFLLGGLVQIAGTLVAKVLLSLGIGYVTYTGLQSFVDTFKSSFTSSLSGMPASAFQLMGVLQIGTCVNIIASALVARLLVSGMTSASGSITKMRTTG